MSKNARRKSEQKELVPAARADAGAEPGKTVGPTHYPRNRLISKMLQDRSVLRLVSAPRGYGRTTLAREYAERLFPGKAVEWVDASSPSFLAGLDEGRMRGFDGAASELPVLIVLDDVPWLHEERAATLSRRIDEALCRGVEVIAITLPSCDCLSALQGERIFLSASDLEITEQECLDGRKNDKSGERVRALRVWRKSGETFMGRVPAVAWGEDEEAQARVLGWFFGERLSIRVLRAAFAAIILKSGPLSALSGSGFSIPEEELRVFSRDYPFLGIDTARERFSFPGAPLEVLRKALEASGAMALLPDEEGNLMGEVLDALLERGDFGRVEEATGAFCTDAQCARWLLDRGWKLIDRGEFELVDSLLERCPGTIFGEFPTLQVMRSWDSGLLGDRLESAHYAQRLLAGRDDGALPEDERSQGNLALAYLALVAFGGKGASIYAKDEFSSGEDPVTAEGFFARVVDLCTDVELERALGPASEDSRRALEKARKPAGEERARALCALFSKNDERFRGEFLYRLAFHLLCYVDSELLKPVVFGIGCELVANSRRNGLLTCTGALVVRDLWRRGFFGPLSSTMGKRDAKLFESAGRILRETAAGIGDGQPDIPWEIDARTLSVPVRRETPKNPRDDVDVLSIRLFGSFEATVGDRFIKEAEWRKKSRMLVILLVLNSGRDVSRDMLFAELWPGMSRVRALDNFYSVWSSACALFGNGPYLERQESFCRVNTRYVVSDVDEFEKLVRRLLTEHPDTNDLLDAYARIESLYRGELVPSERDNQTINAQRTRYRAMYVDAMVAATECSLRVNDARLALWFARKAMETGEQREDLYEALARAQVAAGQRCSAIKTFFECKQYLRDNLGLDPSCDMQDLYDKLISVDPSLMKLAPSSFKKG